MNLVILRLYSFFFFSQFDDVFLGLDWLNVNKPLSSELLKGKIVILDFFTYGCINCFHMFPIIRKLEEKYSLKDGVVIVSTY